jgi:23S rRNA pseudouridine1911/1915/1917 synthase
MADLVEVGIATGRPHQIRIHCAALGAPLLGDPLYLPGGQARVHGLPGEGGYHLHASKLDVCLPGGERLHLCAPPPAGLASGLSATGTNPFTPPHGICHEPARPV